MTPAPNRPLGIVLGAMLLGFLIHTPAFAQKSVLLDSLQRVLRLAKHDSVRATAHAQLCYFLAIRDNDRARTHGREAVALARKLGTARAKAAAHASYGFFQVQTWDMTDGRNNLEAGLKHAIAGRDGKMIVRSLRGLGLAETNSGNPDRALSYYQRAFEAAALSGDSIMMGTVSGEIGTVHHTTGRKTHALEHHLRGLDLLDRHGTRNAAAFQYVNTGKAYLAIGDTENAMSHFTRGISIATEIRDSVDLYGLQHAIGVAFLRRDDNDRALQYFRRALAVLDPVRDGFRLSEVYGNLGLVYSRRGDLDSALVYHERSLAFKERLGLRRHNAVPLFNIATIHYYRGRIDTALELFTRCRAIFEEHDDKVALAKVLHNIAAIQSSGGKYSAALEAYRHIKTLQEQSGDRGGLARTMISIADVNIKLGRPTNALEEAQRCLALSEDTGDKAVQCDALQTIADVHLSQSRYDLALSYQQRALKLCEDMKDNQRGAECLVAIGSSYSGLEQQEKALHFYTRALKIFEDLRIPHSISDVLMRIAREHNLNDRLEESLHYYGRSLSFIRQAPNSAGEVNLLTQMSTICAKRGDLDSAIVLAAQALRIAQQSGHIPGQKSAAHFLAHYYKKKQDYAQAYEYLDLSRLLNDSLTSVEKLRTINEMEAKYTAAEKEKTIAMLEAEKRGQLLSLERKDRQLAVQRLQSERDRSRAEVLAQRHELQFLELAKRTTELELRTKELRLQRVEKEKVAHEKDLQASIANRETSLRNVLLFGLLLFVAVGYLGVHRIQSRRIEATLRAEAAEYRMKAAEAQALALQVDLERREHRARQQYTRELIDTQERERKRIAGELHDSLGQDLLVIKNRALFALQSAQLPASARTEFEQIEYMVTTALKNVRDISHDLRPYQLDRLGLTKTLRSSVQQLAAQSGIHFTIAIDEIDGLFPKADETNVYRIVQECLNNVLKHSGANSAAVRIERNAMQVSIVVTDDGRGIEAQDSGGRLAGFGLQNMRERAEMLEGTFSMTGTRGNGTRVEIALPIRDKDRATARTAA